MAAIPEALVLEDDPTQLSGIVDAVSELRYDVVMARSAADAKRRLIQRSDLLLPTIAIVDWNMDMSPDQSLSIPAFLTWLRSFAHSCTVIVYTVRADLLPVTTAVHKADARAYLQDKRDGVDGLVERLRQMMAVRIGDLVLEGTHVHSLTTQEAFSHHVAMSLMMKFPESIDLRASEASTRAAYRFRKWVADQHSTVEVECVAARHFRLIDRAASRP